MAIVADLSQAFQGHVTSTRHLARSASPRGHPLPAFRSAARSEKLTKIIQLYISWRVIPKCNCLVILSGRKTEPRTLVYTQSARRCLCGFPEIRLLGKHGICGIPGNVGDNAEQGSWRVDHHGFETQYPCDLR